MFFTVHKTFGLDFDIFPNLGYGQVGEVSTQLGCISHRTIQDIGGMLVYRCLGGIAATSGGAPRIISDEIYTEFEDLYHETTGRARDSFAINWATKQKYMCFVRKNSDVVGCSKCIVMDYKQLPGEPQFRFSVYNFTKEFTCGRIEQHAITDSDGNDTNEEYPILGDKDGYVWTFGTGDADGPTTGTVTGTVTSASSSPEIMTDTNAVFDTSGLGLEGMMLTVRRTSDGEEQTVLIGGNTADSLYPDQAWGWIPSAGDTYRIGGIDAYYTTAWSSLGGDEGKKKLHRIISTYTQESGGTIDLDVYKDFETTPLGLDNEGSTADLSAEEGRTARRLSGVRAHWVKFRWRNTNPNEPFTLKNATLVVDERDDPK